MQTPTDRLVLPHGVSAGAAIGAGGQHVREIGTRHNVRCIVNPPQREIAFLGHQTNVANAIADFYKIFDQILATCAEPEKRTPVNAAGESFIHLRALAKTHGEWQFERRDKASLNSDAHAKHYDYQLVSIPTTVSHSPLKGDGTTEPAWVHEFNPAFRTRMVTDISRLCDEKPVQSIRLKAALGLTCFALRDLSLAFQTLSWPQVQALQQDDQIQFRWSSVWDASSPPVAALLGQLLACAAEQAAPTKTTMTVYVGTVDARNSEDVVVKYRYQDYKWVLSTSLRPRRVLLAQYDIGLDTGLACRIRAYTRDATNQKVVGRSIADHVDVVPPTVGSHFLTTAVARHTMPRHRFVRGCTVKDKLEVEWQGVRFVVSFMNKRRTRVRIECGFLGHDMQDKGDDLPLPDAAESLMDKVIAIVTEC